MRLDLTCKNTRRVGWTEWKLVFDFSNNSSTDYFVFWRVWCGSSAFHTLTIRVQNRYICDTRQDWQRPSVMPDLCDCNRVKLKPISHRFSPWPPKQCPKHETTLRNSTHTLTPSLTHPPSPSPIPISSRRSPIDAILPDYYRHVYATFPSNVSKES